MQNRIACFHYNNSTVKSKHKLHFRYNNLTSGDNADIIQKKRSEMFGMKKRSILLIVSGGLTAIIMLIMDVFLIPSIEAGCEGIRYFDMNSFGYTAENARLFLSTLSEEGRALCLNVQLPLDFFYPVAYTTFFILMMKLLIGRKSRLMLFPALLAAADYAENICTVLILRGESVSSALLGCASAFTVTKSTLMTVSVTIILIFLVKYLIRRRKEKQNTDNTD